MDKLTFDPFDEELDMCSNCFEDEEYDFGLCIACVEEAFAEIEEMFEETLDIPTSNVVMFAPANHPTKGN